MIYTSNFGGAEIDALLERADKEFNIVSIPSNSNLDNYTTPGMYGSASSDVTSTIGSKPANLVGAFTLHVFKRGLNTGTGIFHLLYPNDDSGIWFRKTVGNAFGGWNVIPNIPQAYLHKGTTAQRPPLKVTAADGRQNHLEGFFYFDTDLGKPIWWTNDTSDDKSGWVDATGTNMPNASTE